MCLLKFLVLAIVPLSFAQNIPKATNLHNGLTEKIGNFSIELLYHTSNLEQSKGNLIMSPITVWTVLAVIAEGASGNTRRQINHALRLQAKHTNVTRSEFQKISEWLRVNTNTIELAKINAIIVDKQRLPQQDFHDNAKTYYETDMITLNFEDAQNSANLLNSAISNFTHGKIPKIVDTGSFQDTQMLLTSALYFKGQWTIPFNTSSTSKLPFYNSKGEKIGEVNMMYNRHTYPFSNIKILNARVIELPYGVENRLSMLIMVPNPGVSLASMFMKFKELSLDSFFEELRISKEEFSDDEVDCFIPRFKIESNLDMTSVLKNAMGIEDLFDARKAVLPHMARTPMFVSKVVHKAEIEVTEAGTTAAGVTVAEFSNRIGVVRFEANRPFTYMIVEKVTNSIVFGGFYTEPSLY